MALVHRVLGLLTMCFLTWVLFCAVVTRWVVTRSFFSPLVPTFLCSLATALVLFASLPIGRPTDLAVFALDPRPLDWIANVLPRLMHSNSLGRHLAVVLGAPTLLVDILDRRPALSPAVLGSLAALLEDCACSLCLRALAGRPFVFLAEQRRLASRLPGGWAQLCQVDRSLCRLFLATCDWIWPELESLASSLPRRIADPDLTSANRELRFLATLLRQGPPVRLHTAPDPLCLFSAHAAAFPRVSFHHHSFYFQSFVNSISVMLLATSTSWPRIHDLSEACLGQLEAGANSDKSQSLFPRSLHPDDIFYCRLSGFQWFLLKCGKPEGAWATRIGARVVKLLPRLALRYMAFSNGAISLLAWAVVKSRLSLPQLLLTSPRLPETLAQIVHFHLHGTPPEKSLSSDVAAHLLWLPGDPKRLAALVGVAKVLLRLLHLCRVGGDEDSRESRAALFAVLLRADVVRAAALLLSMKWSDEPDEVGWWLHGEKILVRSALALGVAARLSEESGGSSARLTGQLLADAGTAETVARVLRSGKVGPETEVALVAVQTTLESLQPCSLSLAALLHCHPPIFPPSHLSTAAAHFPSAHSVEITF